MNAHSIIKITVAHEDVLWHLTDVLVLKHAQALHGADFEVVTQLQTDGLSLMGQLPYEGQTLWIEQIVSHPFSNLLFVGVPPLPSFEFAEMRQFCHLALQSIAIKQPQARTIALTIHGANYGLDASVALQAIVDGIMDGLLDGYFSDDLAELVIVEHDAHRATLLMEKLKQMVGQGILIIAPTRGTVRVQCDGVAYGED